MWCAAKGINCPDCGVFGECQRTCCDLPNSEPSTLGTSSSYLVNTTSQKLITDIKHDAVKEFAEKLRKKVISLNVWEFGEIDIIDVDDIDELLKEYEE